MGRTIGIRHRVKQTARQEARPTLVAITDGGKTETLSLPDDTAELDFVLGRFPVAWRELRHGEDPASFPPHHLRTDKKKKGSDELPVCRVPSAYEGLKADDTVAMILGGSGDRLAFALSRQAEALGHGTTVMRIPPFVFKSRRPNESKDEDHVLLSSLVGASPSLFYRVEPRDRDFIRMREAFTARRDAMKARMACEQRLRQRVIGRIFLSEEGRYPEGTIEDEFDAVRATDAILNALVKEEAARDRDLKKAVQALEVWQQLFDPIEGCGETIAAGILSAVGDIRAFIAAPRRKNGEAKLKAFLGVHVLTDGRFPRKRGGQIANWSPAGRQALYLLGSQFNYRADSVWGLKLREYKVKLRAKHPEVIIVDGKRRYTDAHIHKMAFWRTLTKFVECLYSDWIKIEAATHARKETASAA